MAISDHSQIFLKYSVNHMQGDARIWRFPAYMTGKECFQTEVRQAWQDFTDFNVEDKDNASLYRDTAKAYTKGQGYNVCGGP